jgi:hypothetical protein
MKHFVAIFLCIAFTTSTLAQSGAPERLRHKDRGVSISTVGGVNSASAKAKYTPETLAWIKKKLKKAKSPKRLSSGSKAPRYVCSEGLGKCLCSSAYDCVKMIGADGKCSTGEGDVTCSESGNWCTCNQP